MARVLRRARSLFILFLLVAAHACGRPAAQTPRATGLFTAEDESQASPFSLRERSARPKLAILERQGDPKPAVAVAVAHDLGPVASVALAALVGERLQRRGRGVAQARAHRFGFQIELLCYDPARAHLFFEDVRAALEAEVSDDDPDLAVVNLQVKKLGGYGFSSTNEALSECSGDLGLDGKKAPPDFSTKAGARELEAFRRRAYQASSTSFGVVGGSRWIQKIEAAWQRQPAWPEGEPVSDPWPLTDTVRSDTKEPQRTVSIAVRTGDPGRALEAARRLGRSDSVLAERLAALDPPWRIERSVGTARRRGGCLRVDLVGPPKLPTHLRVAASVATLARAEASKALSRARGGAFELQRSARDASDPRVAAGRVAWGALVGADPDSEPRTVTTYVAPESQLDPAAFAGELERRQGRSASHSLEVTSAVERGQGQLWLLAASTCGTTPEGVDDAGHTLLALSSLSRAAPDRDGAQVEAWVSPRGAGLLVHGPRRSRAESPKQQAARLARILGRTLISSSPRGSAIARAKHRISSQHGEAPRLGFNHTLQALSPGHPSWLAPHPLNALSSAATGDLQRRLAALVREPLRLAVIANQDQAQVDEATSVFGSWVEPFSSQQLSCPPAEMAAPQKGLVTVTTSEPNEANAYLAVPLPMNPGLTQATEYLLERPGGWLERALIDAKLAGSVRVESLEGLSSTALVVEFFAAKEQLDDAVAQSRALLDRIATGTMTDHEATLANTWLRGMATAARLDPRQRIIELWQGKKPKVSVRADALRKHQRALRAENHILVRVSPSH